MELLNKNHDGATLIFTMEELTILNNALNEILNGIETEEFATRVGVEMEEAQKLQKGFGLILEEW